MSLKFKEEIDKTRFFIEIERFDLLETFEVPEDLIEKFIKKRTGLVKKLKDFRRSQNSKRIWTRHRFSMLKGLRKWHTGLKGKKFHRQLGRFLATRITENTDDILSNRYETLKALSSLRTHIYIEGEYFRASIDEDVDFEILFEYAVPLLNSMEIKLLESDVDSITDDEVEILFRLIDEDEIVNCVAEALNKSNEEIALTLKTSEVNEDLTYGLSLKYFRLLNNNKKIDSLKETMEISEI